MIMKCMQCGTDYQGKYCPECGTQNPSVQSTGPKARKKKPPLPAIVVYSSGDHYCHSRSVIH